MENLRLERLKEFKSTLDKDNQVSKSMVIALEEFIGDNVITKQVNPNKLTNLPSLTQLDTIKTIVDNEIKSEEEKTSLDDQHTAEDMVTVFNGKGNQALLKLLRVVRLLINSDKNTVAPSIKIAAMKDEKIRYRYINRDDETSVLEDILTLPLDNVYVNYKAYFEDVKSFIYGELSESCKYLPEIDREALNSVSIKYNTLLNIIDSVDLSQATEKTPKPITLIDIIAIIENAPVIIDKLERWEDLSGKYWNNNEDNLVPDPDVYNLYKGLCKLIKDDDLMSGEDFITSVLFYMFEKPKSESPAI